MEDECSGAKRPGTGGFFDRPAYCSCFTFQGSMVPSANVEVKILKEEDRCFKCARREACRRFPVLIVLKERTLHVIEVMFF